MNETKKPVRGVIHKEFARRLEQACDGNVNIPQIYHGRLKWFSEQYQERWGRAVPQETIRRWFAGLSKPRQEDLVKMAQILKVDPAWLAIGVPNKSTETVMASNGAVNIVAGFIQMGGGRPALPQDDDDEADKNHIDLYAIVDGAKHNITVVVAVPGEPDAKFVVPVAAKKNVILGVVRGIGTSVTIYDLEWDTLEKSGTRVGADIEIAVEGGNWRKISQLSDRFKRG